MAAHVTIDSFYEIRKRPAFGRELAAGLRAGGAAGLVMMGALMTIHSVFLHKSPFYPLQVIAACVVGEGSLARFDASTLVAGALVHLVPALVWGLFFGVVVWAVKPRRSLTLTMLGLLVGVVALITDAHVLLPELSRSLAGKLPILVPLQHANVWSAHVPLAASWVAHLVYGFTLSLYPWKYDPLARTFD